MKRNLRLFFKWLLFSPLYIKEAQSVGVTKWKRNLLFICSPFILICIGLVLGTVIPVAFFGGLLLVALTEKDEPLPYDSVRFKTREEIVNVTGLEDFPEFSYITNDDADWTGIGVYVYLEFKDELPESFYEKLESLSQSGPYWTYSDGGYYIFNRSWGDGCRPFPGADMGDSEGSVEISIRRDSRNFRINYDVGAAIPVDPSAAGFENAELVWSKTTNVFPTSCRYRYYIGNMDMDSLMQANSKWSYDADSQCYEYFDPDSVSFSVKKGSRYADCYCGN